MLPLLPTFFLTLSPWLVSAQDTAGLTRAAKALVPDCNDHARAWIRAAYHDAATFDSSTNSGGADGSLQFELDRSENRGLEPTLAEYRQLSQQFKVTMADTIALGGQLAFEVCSGRTLGEFKFGRRDASGPNAGGLLVGASASAEDTLNAFVKRLGFSVQQTVALVGGAHSVARVHSRNSPGLREGSLDTTPHRVDSNYFREIQMSPAPTTRIPADVNMMNHPDMKHWFQQFAQNEGLLLDTFGDAFKRMLSLGMEVHEDDQEKKKKEEEEADNDDEKKKKDGDENKSKEAGVAGNRTEPSEDGKEASSKKSNASVNAGGSALSLLLFITFMVSLF